MADPVSSLPDAVLAALRAGDPLQAARLLRQAKGVSLKHAKAVIETWMSDGRSIETSTEPAAPADAPSVGAGKAPGSVVDLLAAGRHAEAVRLMRELTGLGAQQASEVVESMLPASKRRLRLGGDSRLSPGEVPRGRGVGRWLALAVLAVYGLWLLLRSPG